MEHEGEIAAAIRRFLRQPAFRTHAQRMGKVVRLHPDGVPYWALGAAVLHSTAWSGA